MSVPLRQIPPATTMTTITTIMMMSALIILTVVPLPWVVRGQKHGDKFQGEQWGANPKDPYTYDPRLDPKDEKRFDPILWYNEIFSNPERSVAAEY